MRLSEATRAQWQRLDDHPRLRRLRSPWLIGGLVAAKLAAVVVLWVAVDAWSRMPDPASFRGLDEMPEATVVYDRFDRPAFTIFEQQRLSVPLDKVSSDLVSAVLAIEDRRFYKHSGIDVVRIGGAAVANMQAGRIVQGGSTITQQLARQSLLSTERSWARKLAEVATAVRIELAYSKPEILSLYLNRIYFGDGFYGVEAAARGYFGKSASELTLGEGSLLAGLIQAPERYSPTKYPDRALRRREVVLGAMVDAGLADQAAIDGAREELIVLSNALRSADRFGAYFKEEVRRQLVDLFGWEQVATGGLHVFTTIDPTLQRAAEAAIDRGVRRIEARRGYRHPHPGSEPAATPADFLQGALIALDPRTGEVRAVVGGRDFEQSSFNRATQALRQPGSAFKPFVFAAALEAGMTPATVLTGLDEPTATPQGDWLPADGHVEQPTLSVRQALRVSSNRAAVKVASVTGLDRAVGSVRRFQLGDHPAVPSLPLGPGEVTVEAMAAAYSAFANGGVVPTPFYIRKVRNAADEEVFAANPVFSRAVTRATAFQMATLLADVVDSGTGYKVRAEGFKLPAGGKTGTTNDSNDVWFVGFTPSLVAGVWMGFDEPQTIIRDGYASDLAAPVWADFMKTATRGAAPEWLKPPPDVTSAEICIVSGALATNRCRDAHLEDAQGNWRRVTYREYFAMGTEPVEECSVHRPPALFRFMAGVFGRDETEGESASTTVLPRGTLVDAPAPAQPADSPVVLLEPVGDGEPDNEDNKPKKKSFWRRVFRLGF